MALEGPPHRDVAALLFLVFGGGPDMMTIIRGEKDENLLLVIPTRILKACIQIVR